MEQFHLLFLNGRGTITVNSRRYFHNFKPIIVLFVLGFVSKQSENKPIPGERDLRYELQQNKVSKFGRTASVEKDKLVAESRSLARENFTTLATSYK